MLKVLGKLKAQKDKSKKDKSERHNDEGPTVKGFREKDKPIRSKTLKKKNVSVFSDEPLSVDNSQANFEDQLDGIGNRRRKRRVSKECLEMVNKAVAEFFDHAWMACAERFFITTAPLTVSFELRNTWLRIMEVEWLDRALVENKSRTKTNKIFKRDTPPLPLAFDSWSRGGLEPLPRFRRESVIDPFLRDNFTPAQFSIPTRVSARSYPPEELLASDIEVSLVGTPEEIPTNEEIEQEQTFGEANVLFSEDWPDSPTQIIPAKDKWNFDLDPEISLILDIKPASDVTLPLPPSGYNVSAFSSENELEQEQTPVFAVLSPRPVQLSQLSESTTDNDEISSPDSIRRYTGRQKSIGQSLSKRFSPGQCGGETGSGIFRLHLETTSEALLKRKSLHVPPEAPLFGLNNQIELEEDEKLDKSRQSSQSINDNDDDDDASIQPLFSERKTRVYTGQDMHQFTKNLPGRRSSYKQFQDPTLGRTASEIENKFLKRRLANLQGHFKRQARRALAARARQKEQIMKLSVRRKSSSTLSVALSKTSSGSNNSNNRTRHNKTDSIFPAENRGKSTSDPQIIFKSKSIEKIEQMQQQQLAGDTTAGKARPNKKAKNIIFRKSVERNVHATTSQWGQFSSLRTGKFDGKITSSQQQLLRARFENARFSSNRRLGNVKKSNESLQSSFSDCQTIDWCSENETPP